MNGCTETRRHLLEAPEPAASLPETLEAHLRQCASCQTLQADLVLMQELARADAEPELPAGFELSLRRKLRQAEQEDEAAPREARPDADRSARGRRLWFVAAAAGVLLVVGASLLWARLTGPGQAEVDRWHLLQLEVNVAATSARARFEIQLPPGVRLAREAGIGLGSGQKLSWESPLRPGKNMVELPLEASRPGGVVHASLTVGQTVQRAEVILPGGRAVTRSRTTRAGPRLAWNLAAGPSSTGSMGEVRP